MIKIVAIARNTFKEAIRNRILYVILIFALLLIGFSGVVSELTITDRMRIIKNLGFAAINLFGVAIAVFVGVSLVYNEIEKRTIYTIVSKPISRWQFLLGKYFGLLATVLVNIVIMSFFFLASVHYNDLIDQADHTFLPTLAASIGKAFMSFFWWSGSGVAAGIMPVIAISCLEMAIITSFAVLYSSFSTPTLSMFFSVLTFVAGRLNEDIVRFTDQVWVNAHQIAMAAGKDIVLPFSYYFATAAAYVIPNLGAFQQATESAIYGTVQQSVQQPGASGFWWGTVLYGIVYSAGVLALSTLIFNRRNFK